MPTHPQNANDFFTARTTFTTQQADKPQLTFHCMAVGPHPGHGGLCAIGLNHEPDTDDWKLAIYTRQDWVGRAWVRVDGPHPTARDHEAGSSASRVYWDYPLGVSPMKDGGAEVWLASDHGEPLLWVVDPERFEVFAGEVNTAFSTSSAGHSQSDSLAGNTHRSVSAPSLL